MTQTMNDGTSTSSASGNLNPPTEGQAETLNEFMQKVANAKLEGTEWVETSPEIIHHFNRKGLGGSGYFTYDGLKVCGWGMSDELEETDQRQLGNTEGGTIVRTGH